MVLMAAVGVGGRWYWYSLAMKVAGVGAGW